MFRVPYLYIICQYMCPLYRHTPRPCPTSKCFAFVGCTAFAISHLQEKADIVSKLPYRLFLWMLHFSMLQHVFNKDSISSGAVLDEDVGDCADELTVLDNGAAAHSLDNTAGELQQVRVRHL